MITFTSRDGTRVACQRTGDGPPLVLVHGATADHTRWTGLLPALDARFTVVALDRRGRGASGDAADYALEREADDLVAVVDGIGGPVDLLAHSYGALIALEAAPRLASLRRLVLYEPPVVTGPPLTDAGLMDRLEALLAAGDPEELVMTFLREAPRIPPAQLAVMRGLPSWRGRVAAAHTIPRELRAVERHALGPALSRVTAPALLLLGSDSPPPVRASTEAVAAALPHARVALLPGQQHVAMDTAPELFLREVLAFLLLT